MVWGKETAAQILFMNIALIETKLDCDSAVLQDMSAHGSRKTAKRIPYVL